MGAKLRVMLAKLSTVPKLGSVIAMPKQRTASATVTQKAWLVRTRCSEGLFLDPDDVGDRGMAGFGRGLRNATLHGSLP